MRSGHYGERLRVWSLRAKFRNCLVRAHGIILSISTMFVPWSYLVLGYICPVCPGGLSLVIRFLPRQCVLLTFFKVLHGAIESCISSKLPFGRLRIFSVPRLHLSGRVCSLSLFRTASAFNFLIWWLWVKDSDDSFGYRLP